MHSGLLLTGVTGVGKSSLIGAVGRVLSTRGDRTAVVDTDALAQFGPPPPRESTDTRRSFHDELKCRNLAAVWANFRASGARYIVVAAGIESVELRADYAAALDGCAVQLVRLTAPRDVVRERLRGRDDGAKLDRHLATLSEQEARLDALRLEDFSIANDRPLPEVAEELVSRAGWST